MRRRAATRQTDNAGALRAEPGCDRVSERADHANISRAERVHRGGCRWRGGQRLARESALADVARSRRVRVRAVFAAHKRQQRSPVLAQVRGGRDHDGVRRSDGAAHQSRRQQSQQHVGRA